MEQRKKWLALLLCVLLFGTALVMVLFEEERDTPQQKQPVGTVVISEIMTSNCTYPDDFGKLLDYIEVHNLSDQAVDISGYMLSDKESAIGYRFPKGTVLEPYGYAVCWCDSHSGSDTYAAFQLSKDGGETVYLYNSANVLIDTLEIPALERNTPYLRGADGTWSVGKLGSPGFPNTLQGNVQWLEHKGYEQPQILISEVQSANSRTWLDPQHSVCDWIELYNTGNKPVVLDGAYLSDDPENPLKWQISSLTVDAGGYAVIRCGGQGEQDADFRLDRSGCTLVLSGAFGNEICRLVCPELDKNTAWAYQNGDYQVTMTPTPGFENTEEGYGLWLDAVGVTRPQILISEVQTSNRSAVLDHNGQLCDWIELCNHGTESAVLDGCFLSDDPADPMKWEITGVTLKPGQYLVIPCVGANAGTGEATFSLPKTGCAIVLSGPVGNMITQTECPAMEDDRSWQRLEDGTYIQTDRVSPGYDNTDEGYEAYVKSRKMMGALAVNEVMPSNNRFMMQSDGEFYDWVELKNGSDAPIDLSEYFLSNNSGDLRMFRLPQKTLRPGETVVVICSGKPELAGNDIQAPFTLNREECWVYVSHETDGLSDYVRIHGVPLQGSAGRMNGEAGLFFFTTPTPGKENAGGIAKIAQAPFVETPGGVYNNVDSVRVILSGEGQIRYTLDGSEPTMRSALYTEPLLLTQTTTVRAATFCEGMIPSQAVTAGYIINENHTLPVLCISADPYELFGSNGIYTRYTQNREIPCNLTLYETDGSGFSVDCGVKLYGHTGLELDKKSFKVNFRGCYGSRVLTYPVFGEDGPYVFDSLCIRSGQDYPQAIFRDELFASLCRQMSDSVLTQREKFCILYVNGEYFGIYCMKEAFTELYYAQNRGVTEESVEIVQAPVNADTEMYRFMCYLLSHDMADEDHYAYASSFINVDSLIDWIIIQGYSTNGDVQQNLRYFRSTDNGNRFEMAFYDLDWSFYYHNPFAVVLKADTEWQHRFLTRPLMKNPGFRQQFLERLSYHMSNTLSTENVLARIDYYHDLLAPEVERERRKWGGTVSSWEWQVDRLRNFITKSDHLRDLVSHLVDYIGLTREEIDTYFGRWYG